MTTFEPDTLIKSPQFRASDPQSERACLIIAIGGPLGDYAAQYADNREQQNTAFEAAQERLEDAVTADTVCRIAEALELVGVTDKTHISEVCRVVVKGGHMWDGNGFRKEEVTNPRKPAAPDPSFDIQASETFPPALSELIDVHIRTSQDRDEESLVSKLGAAACQSSWEALSETINTYANRRFREMLKAQPSQ